MSARGTRPWGVSQPVGIVQGVGTLLCLASVTNFVARVAVRQEERFRGPFPVPCCKAVDRDVTAGGELCSSASLAHTAHWPGRTAMVRVGMYSMSQPLEAPRNDVVDLPHGDTLDDAVDIQGTDEVPTLQGFEATGD